MLSLIIASLVRTREQFMGIGQLLTMPLFFASNAIYPLAIMPAWLHVVARLNPQLRSRCAAPVTLDLWISACQWVCFPIYAARTEQYWCPIEHAHAPAARHGRYHRFFDYGDAERYHCDRVALRGTLRPGEPDSRDGGKGGDHAHNIH